MKKNGKKAQSSSWITLEFQPSEDLNDVTVKGEWDDWKGTAMRKKKNGSFYLRKKIPVGTWECGFECNHDSWKINPEITTKASPFGSLNNVITVSE